LRDGVLANVTTTNGLSSNFAWALHEDAEGLLWIGTERGLNRLDHDRITFRVGLVLAVAAVGLGLYRWRVKELRLLHRLQQEQALASERARIARDLHDGLGADLTQLSLLADLVGQELPRPEAAQGQLDRLATGTRRAAQALREIISATNPEDSTLDGLVTRICHYAQTLLGAARIRCRFDVPVELPEVPLSTAVRQDLYLVAKEALNNVARHSQATEVRLRVAIANDTLALTIADNGRGLACAVHDGNSSGMGLVTMRRRVEELGGKIEIASQPGGGTTVDVVLPMHAGQA